MARVIQNLPLLVVAALLAWPGAWGVSPVQVALSSDAPDSCLELDDTHKFYATGVSLPQLDDCSTPDPLHPSKNPELKLPDLRTLAPFDLAIVMLPGNLHELRLSNTVWNSGEGTLELEGIVDPVTRTVSVEQNILTENGSQIERSIGEFTWHTLHKH